jgi:DNA-binding MarR family transcriptional regulator
MPINNNVVSDLERLLMALNQILNQITKSYLADKGLSMPRFWVLRKLGPEKAMTMGELQRQMYLAPATITGLVDALVEKGWVHRYRDEGDRRVVLLNLTPSGKALVDEVLNYRVANLKTALESQDNIDITLLNSCLGSIYEQLDKPIHQQ